MHSILTKYSRQYPSGASQSQSQSNQQEWQHYVNPTIKLTLTKTKDATGRINRAELTVVWSMNVGADDMDVDGQQIIFENLDLLAFPATYQPNNPPLKAVYRDAVVGIRYQYPAVPGPGVIPTFRRFQVIFDSAHSATAFISAIEDICPCKYNVPTANPARTMSMAPPNAHRTATASKSIMSLNRTATIQVPPPARRPQPSSVNQLQRSSSPNSLSSLSSLVVSSDPPPLPFSTSSSDALRGGGTILHSSRHATISVHHDGDAPSSDSSIVLPGAFRHAHTNAQRTTQVGAQQHSNLAHAPTLYSAPGSNSVPSSSLPHSSSQQTITSSSSSSNDLSAPASTSIPTPASAPTTASASSSTTFSAATSSTAPPRPFSQSNVSPFLDALKETTPSLHDLSTAELETLVASVIWEEGFQELVQKLDKMWAIQGVLRSM
ncbi:hypothetical protein BDV98DRAFT_593341 [Pterulicium gracile]|uniref:Uncharacterized protein n=1 Tax=Pterulicium gracile TaxID=1884261 RepID=A0A5C3QJE0_9AGAR|nr:hypothetical protein BDV98DRAFT_593341 [Pterula gracilis]